MVHMSPIPSSSLDRGLGSHLLAKTTHMRNQMEIRDETHQYSSESTCGRLVGRQLYSLLDDICRNPHQTSRHICKEARCQIHARFAVWKMFQECVLGDFITRKVQCVSRNRRGSNSTKSSIQRFRFPGRCENENE